MVHSIKDIIIIKESLNLLKIKHLFWWKQRASVTNEILEKSKGDIPNSYITYNDQIDGVSSKVKNFNVTPESIYLIDYKVSKKNNYIKTPIKYSLWNVYFIRSFYFTNKDF